MESAPTTMRLFTALWPEPDVRAAIAAVSQSMAWPGGARPTAHAKLHMTLHFLGDVDDDRLPALCTALAVPAPAFELRLDQLQAWPGGLLVLCPSSIPPPLARQRADLAERLLALGVRVDARAFAPHVTLARRAPPHCAQRSLPPVRWPVRGHALVQSTPQGGYAVLQRWDAARPTG